MKDKFKVLINNELYTINGYIVRQLILRRAYKGYVRYNELEKSKPLTYEDFCKLEFWKIKMSFNMCFTYFKGGKYILNDHISFRSIVLNIL